ncbi:MAG: Glu-tRNA(Gln) amidotransferase subunit GatE, partial [Thermoproteota archaeon]
LGTIRQDINISVEGGSRQEIKGVQDLRLIPKIVELEVQRQVKLLEIRDELRDRGASTFDKFVINLSNVLRSTRSEIISSSLNKGWIVAGLKLPKFAGVLKKEIQPGRRFGTELAEYAKVWGGVGGIIHSDELPNYGLTEDELREINEVLRAGSGDVFVLVTGPMDRVERALTAVYERAISALIGVPSETRKSNEDGTTSYMRPLPGPSRMYPETDVPPVVITSKMLSEVMRSIPPLPSQKLEQFKSMGLTEHMAMQMLRSPMFQLFEEAVSDGAEAIFTASIILNSMPFLRREGTNVDDIPDDRLKEFFVSFSRSGLPKEAVDDVLKIMSLGKSPEEAYRELSQRLANEAEIRTFVRELVDSKREFIRSKGLEHAHKALMGVTMSRFRGRVAGNLVSRILWEYLKEVC